MKIISYLSILITPFVLFAESKEITITGNDTMQFDLKTIEVNAGDKVKTHLQKYWQIPKIAMGHNLVVLKKGVSAIAFDPKAMELETTRPTHFRIGKR